MGGKEHELVHKLGSAHRISRPSTKHLHDLAFDGIEVLDLDADLVAQDRARVVEVKTADGPLDDSVMTIAVPEYRVCLSDIESFGCLEIHGCDAINNLSSETFVVLNRGLDLICEQFSSLRAIVSDM